MVKNSLVMQEPWVGKIPWRRTWQPTPVFLGFPGGFAKNSLAMQEPWVPSLGWEDPLEESMATHSSILAWRIPINRGNWRAMVHGVAELDMTEVT